MKGTRNIGEGCKMSGQQITIPLDIADVNVLSVDYTGDAYHIRLESTLTYGYCRKCGQKITALHERDAWVKVQHLPILDRAVFLVLQPYIHEISPISARLRLLHRVRNGVTMRFQKRPHSKCGCSISTTTADLWIEWPDAF